MQLFLVEMTCLQARGVTHRYPYIDLHTCMHTYVHASHHYCIGYWLPSKPKVFIPKLYALHISVLCCWVIMTAFQLTCNHSMSILNDNKPVTALLFKATLKVGFQITNMIDHNCEKTNKQKYLSFSIPKRLTKFSLLFTNWS